MPAQDIQVRIPSQEGEKSIAARILPGKGPTPLPPVAESQPVAAPTPVAEASAPARPEAKPEPKPKPNQWPNPR